MQQAWCACSARLSPAHCRFTASVVALAAIKNSCDTKGIRVHKHGDSTSARPFGMDLVGLQHDRSLVQEYVSEDSLSGTGPGTICLCTKLSCIGTLCICTALQARAVYTANMLNHSRGLFLNVRVQVSLNSRMGETAPDGFCARNVCMRCLDFVCMPSGCIICVVRAREELYNLLKKLKHETQQLNRTAAAGAHATKPHFGSPHAVVKAGPGPSASTPAGGGIVKREREELEEGECVAWGDEDVGEPLAKKAREDEWQPPAVDAPVDDAWRPQAPPPPPTHPDTPPSAQCIAASVNDETGGGPGEQNVRPPAQASAPDSGPGGPMRGTGAGGKEVATQGSHAEDSKLSGNESLEEGEVR